METNKAIKKSADYIVDLIQTPGRCSCWPMCAGKFVLKELRSLVRRLGVKKSRR